MILHHRVLPQPLLVVVNIMEGGRQFIVMQTIAGQVFDDEQFQFTQFLVGLLVVLGEGIDTIFRGSFAVEECLNIGEEIALFVGHVAAYLLSVLVIEFQYQPGQ